MNDAIRETFWARLYRFKVHHVLFWAGYFAFWIFFYRNYYPSLAPLVFTTSVYFFFNAAAFYITGYYLFPRFLYRSEYGKFFLSLGALIISLSVGLAVCLHFLFHGNNDEIAGNWTGLLQVALLSISTMLGLMSGAKLVADKMRSDRKTRQMDKQRLESELQYLKAQVNPHFLFNAINSVYFLIRKNPEQAAETLIKLSDLLRFSLYDCSVEKITIEKEIEYLNNFIALESLRKGEKVKVNLVQEGMLSGFQIAPFLLIPFLENAFKHISNFSNKDNTIDIHFQRNNGKFTAEMSNTTDNIVRNGVGGIGLKNVKRRLELLYPGKHALNISESDGKFIVQLALDIA